ncbi:MAG: hypothetical protein AAF664_04770 [Planctomycetota bacterium]
MRPVDAKDQSSPLWLFTEDGEFSGPAMVGCSRLRADYLQGDHFGNWLSEPA